MNRHPRPAVIAAGATSGRCAPLVDRFRAWRSRVIANPEFRRLAARLAVTRPVARRHTAALFDLCTGFVHSQVLSAFVRLNLVDLLAGTPLNVRDVALATGLPVERADRLMRAAVALKLAEPRSGDRFGLGLLGSALVGNDGVRAMIEHHGLLYDDLADPVALLRGETETRLSGYWAYGNAEGENAAAYSRLMARSQDFIAQEVLDALRTEDCGHLLDVGGGTGTFVEAAARRHPSLRLTLFDLPAVAKIASDRMHAAGLADRISVVEGDFSIDELPQDADVVTLVRVLHDHDDDVALPLLRAVRRALPKGGRLAIAEPMAGTPGAEAAGDAYFGFYLLAMGRGRPRSVEEIANLARAAGFRDVKAAPTATPLIVRVAVATV